MLLEINSAGGNLICNLSASLTSPQPHRLPVFLQLRDQAIALLDNVAVLLVFVIGAVRLDDPVDAVDGTGDAVRGYEFGEISVGGLESQRNLNI